jgi:hypothetical protein
MTMSADVDYTISKGTEILIEVEGEWDSGYDGDFYEPPRGPGLEDYEIAITLADGKRYDILPLLSDSVIDDIIDMANQQIREALRSNI